METISVINPLLISALFFVFPNSLDLKTCKKKCFFIYPKMFFKIFLPDQSSHCLQFPPAFLQFFSGNVPSRSTISTTKSSWKVDLEKINGNLYFRNGWEQFVQDNSLQYGDFLEFAYGGKSKFNVKIYGRDGCEKEVTHYIEENTNGPPIPKIAGASRRGRHVGRPRGVSAKKKTLCFEVMFKKYHCRYMTIPKVFLRGAGIKRNSFVVFRNKQGKSWPVNLIKRTHVGSHGRFDTGTGWRKFWDDNKLTLKHSCLFKFVHGSGNIIQVKISSAK